MSFKIFIYSSFTLFTNSPMASFHFYYQGNYTTSKMFCKPKKRLVVFQTNLKHVICYSDISSAFFNIFFTNFVFINAYTIIAPIVFNIISSISVEPL